MKTIGLVLISFLLLELACCKRIENNTSSITLTDATQLLNSYCAALSTCDSNAVKTFWSQKSLARRGFWTIHNYFYPWGTFTNWKVFIQGEKYDVQNIDRGDKYYVLRVNWVPKNSLVDQIQNIKFHVVRENDRWVFINPLDLFTADWKTYGTEHILYHYPPEIKISDYLDEIRYHIDKLELIVDNEKWPLPKYRELLFIR